MPARLRTGDTAVHGAEAPAPGAGVPTAGSVVEGGPVSPLSPGRVCSPCVWLQGRVRGVCVCLRRSGWLCGSRKPVWVGASVGGFPRGHGACLSCGSPGLSPVAPVPPNLYPSQGHHAHGYKSGSSGQVSVPHPGPLTPALGGPHCQPGWTSFIVWFSGMDFETGSRAVAQAGVQQCSHSSRQPRPPGLQ